MAEQKACPPHPPKSFPCSARSSQFSLLSLVSHRTGGTQAGRAVAARMAWERARCSPLNESAAVRKVHSMYYIITIIVIIVGGVSMLRASKPQCPKKNRATTPPYL